MILNSTQIQYIIIYRGLGYSQQDVTDKIKCSRKTVESYLYDFKKEAEKNGIDKTFWSYFNVNSLKEIMCFEQR